MCSCARVTSAGSVSRNGDFVVEDGATVAADGEDPDFDLPFPFPFPLDGVGDEEELVTCSVGVGALESAVAGDNSSKTSERVERKVLTSG